MAEHWVRAGCLSRFSSFMVRVSASDAVMHAVLPDRRTAIMPRIPDKSKPLFFFVYFETPWARRFDSSPLSPPFRLCPLLLYSVPCSEKGCAMATRPSPISRSKPDHAIYSSSRCNCHVLPPILFVPLAAVHVCDLYDHLHLVLIQMPFLSCQVLSHAQWPSLDTASHENETDSNTMLCGPSRKAALYFMVTTVYDFCIRPQVGVGNDNKKPM